MVNRAVLESDSAAGSDNPRIRGYFAPTKLACCDGGAACARTANPSAIFLSLWQGPSRGHDRASANADRDPALVDATGPRIRAVAVGLREAGRMLLAVLHRRTGLALHGRRLVASLVASAGRDCGRFAVVAAVSSARHGAPRQMVVFGIGPDRRDPPGALRRSACAGHEAQLRRGRAAVNLRQAIRTSSRGGGPARRALPRSDDAGAAQPGEPRAKSSTNAAEIGEQQDASPQAFCGGPVAPADASVHGKDREYQQAVSQAQSCGPDAGQTGP